VEDTDCDNDDMIMMMIGSQTGSTSMSILMMRRVDDIVDFTVGDVLGKTLALVNQVSSFYFVLSLCLLVW